MKRTALILFGLLLSSPCLAGTARIIDGDTLQIGEATYRFHGIDAPEAGQKCKKAGGGTWPCGKRATEALIEMTAGRDVACERRDDDAYGRVVAVCRVDGTDLNAAMIDSGMAWAFRRYSNDYSGLEDRARAARAGVWQAATQSPWDYRAARWEVAEQEAPEGCPIKGNIARDGERIYHAPWSPWYSRTKVSPEKGERWFCDEREAVEAGWRAPIWGR